MIDGGLRPLFRAHLPTFDWQSVETGGTGRGVPDSNYCFHGVEGWVEFKVTKHWGVTLRPEQIGWIERRARHGGRVWVAVRRCSPPADELWLVPGVLVREARTSGLRSPLIRQAAGEVGMPTLGGPHAWEWPRVAEALASNYALPA